MYFNFWKTILLTLIGVGVGVIIIIKAKTIALFLLIHDPNHNILFVVWFVLIIVAIAVERLYNRKILLWNKIQEEKKNEKKQ